MPTISRHGFFPVADRCPDDVALVTPSEERVTNQQLCQEMHRIAHGLRSVGLGAGDTVAVVLANDRTFFEVYGAAAETGLTFVALNWHLGSDEMGYILEDCRARALVIDDRFAETARVAADEAGVPREGRFSTGTAHGFRPIDELVAGQSVDAPENRQAGLVMFYTSGTTGRPKGVRKHVPMAQADEVTLASAIGLGRSLPSVTDLLDGADKDSNTVHIVCGPLYHAAPIAVAAIALDRGEPLVLMDKWTPEQFLELVERHHVTDASMVPTMFHRLLALPDRARRDADVSSLRRVYHAGAPCPIDVKHRMLEWWGPIISEAYSATEGAGTSVTAEEWLQKPGTVGRPSSGVAIAIIDEEGNECPPRAPGLVYMTPTLWNFEYENDQERTISSRRSGMFTVGDIGYLDEDGYLFLCDRQSEIIISGGVNIYPAEVESILLAHPDVADAAVIGAPNDEWGEEVRAVIELHSGAQSGPEVGQVLIEFCRSRIAHYKCPRHVDLVESLGRDANGKLRRRSIRDRYWEGYARKI
jgi:long-chain acyl-CoA synthetase